MAESLPISAIEAAADAIWTEVDGPLGRQSMEDLHGRDLERAQAEAALGALGLEVERRSDYQGEAHWNEYRLVSKWTLEKS